MAKRSIVRLETEELPQKDEGSPEGVEQLDQSDMEQDPFKVAGCVEEE